MEISDDLLCVFTRNAEETEDGAVVRIPEQEIELGTLSPGETYRIAIYRQTTQETPAAAPRQESSRAVPKPPVEEGEHVDVEIEGIGDEGDGIARVERGFVIIVPDTEVGERVTVEITDVRQRVAFADVVERYHPKID